MADKAIALEFSMKLAKEAGSIMRRNFATDEFDLKSDGTKVTAADKAINQLVIKSVKKKFPGHAVLGEEGDFGPGDATYMWVCDPIDGTIPFVQGIPVSTFNLTLLENGQPQTAVTYEPHSDRLFFAARKEGAYLNGKKINARQNAEKLVHLNIEVWGRDASGGTLFDDPDIGDKLRLALTDRNYLKYYFCSVAFSFALVACGSLDGVVFSGTNPWDMAAGALIGSEAGAKVTDIYGDDIECFDKPIKGAIIAGPDTHTKLLEAVRQVTPKRAK